MATYIPGSKVYVPNYQPFTPDFKFLSNALDARTDKYETNYKYLNDLYGRVVYSDLSRQDTNGLRDEYANELAPTLEQISGMDLSLAQNVDAAKAVFTPFFENDLIVKDMVTTAQYRKEMARANRFLNSNQSEIRKKYWETGIKAMDYQMQDFIDASASEALQMATPKYVPNVNLMDVSRNILKESGYGEMESLEWTPDGRYRIVMAGGNQVAAPAYQLLQSTLLDDPSVVRAYYTDAYVDMRDFVANGMEQGAFSTADAGKRTWADQTIQTAQALLGVQLQESQTEVDVLAENVKQWEDYAAKHEIIPGSPEDLAIQKANDDYAAAQQKQQRYGDAYQLSESPTTNTDALLNRAYNVMMQTNIASDLQAAALEYADVTRRVKSVTADEYALADYKHRQKMKEIYASNSSSSSSTKKTEEDQSIDALLSGMGLSGTQSDSEGTGSVTRTGGEDENYVEDIIVGGAAQASADLQKEAADVYVTGEQLLSGSPTIQFEAYNEDGSLETFNVSADKAKEILTRPENSQIVADLVHDNSQRLFNTQATDVEVAPGEKASNKNGYAATLADNPEAFAAAQLLYLDFGLKEENVADAINYNTDKMFENLNSLTIAEYGEDLQDAAADYGGIPSIFKDYIITPNGLKYTGNPEDIDKPKELLSKLDYINLFQELPVRTFAKNPNAFQDAMGMDMTKNTYTMDFTPEEYNQIYNGGYTLGSGRVITPDLVTKVEKTEEGWFGLRPESYEVTYLREDYETIFDDEFTSGPYAGGKAFDSRAARDQRYIANDIYRSQYTLLNEGAKLPDTQFGGYVDVETAISGGGFQSGSTEIGKTYNVEVNPRALTMDGAVMLRELNDILTAGPDNIEYTVNAVMTDDDVRGQDKSFGELTNDEKAQYFLESIIIPQTIALRNNPGTGEQGVNDLRYIISKDDISNQADGDEDVITTYTIELTPGYLNTLKLSGAGVDLFGAEAAMGDNATGSSAITDFLQIQVAVRKPQLDLYLPNQVGVRAGEGTVPQYTAAMMSEDKIFRYSLPRGGFYEMWIPDPLNKPLDIVYKIGTAKRDDDGNFVVGNTQIIEKVYDDFELLKEDIDLMNATILAKSRENNLN